MVDKFYEEVIKVGGSCNGKRRLREWYHPEYYGAFIMDPVGCVKSLCSLIGLLK